jgi:hypothetical protein
MPVYNQNDNIKDDEDMNWSAGGGRKSETFFASLKKQNMNSPLQLQAQWQAEAPSCRCALVQ